MSQQVRIPLSMTMKTTYKDAEVIAPEPLYFAAGNCFRSSPRLVEHGFTKMRGDIYYILIFNQGPLINRRIFTLHKSWNTMVDEAPQINRCWLNFRLYQFVSKVLILDGKNIWTGMIVAPVELITTLLELCFCRHRVGHLWNLTYHWVRPIHKKLLFTELELFQARTVRVEKRFWRCVELILPKLVHVNTNCTPGPLKNQEIWKWIDTLTPYDTWFKTYLPLDKGQNLPTKLGQERYSNYKNQPLATHSLHILMAS